MADPTVPTDVPRESSRTILFQFVVFPLGVVCIAVAIFFLFGKLASDDQSIPDYLNQIRSGSSHERWQAAYQLSKSIKRGEAKRYPNLEQQVASLYVGSRSDDPRIRRYLSMVLGTLGDARATPFLIEGLKDAEVENRLYALMALGQLHDPASLPGVIAASQDSEKDVRKAALFALGEIGDRRAVPALIHALEDGVADVRWNAAIALARMGDSHALGPLREMLDRGRLNSIAGMREDQKEDTMIVAMTEFVKLAPAEALPQLQRIATSDPSLRIRSVAKQAIEQIRK